MGTTSIIDTNKLLSELNYYRDQNIQLRRTNDLYSRIVGIIDLPSLIEAYSIWLMQYIRFLLIGYINPTTNRNHYLCAAHGSDRNNVMTLAKKIMLDTTTTKTYQQYNGIFPYRWALNSKKENGAIILFKQNTPMNKDEQKIIEASLQAMNEPVRKVLDYEKVYQQARKDPLTDLPNRLFFNEHIDSLIELANRHNRPFTIAALDLDHFKQINDTKGHMEGDQVLQQIAATLKKEIRLSDNLIRTGGDEFLLTLQETDLEASRHLCTRLCQSIEGLDIHTEQTKLCLSIGLATYRSDLTLEQLLTHADNMLYKAKANGGNSVVG